MAKKVFSFLTSHLSSPRGFTLIELIVVLAIMGLLTASGIAAYTSYNSMQLMNTTQAELVDVLTIAKSRAVSQVNPPECAGQTLTAYQVEVSVSANQYILQVVCGESKHDLQTRKLPSQITFEAGSLPLVTFALATGTVLAPGTISFTGYDQTRQITIETTGNIMSDKR